MSKRIFWLVLAAFVIFTAAACTSCTEEATEAPEIAQPQYDSSVVEQPIVMIGRASRELILEKPTEEEITSPRLYEPSDFQFLGVLNWNGYRWTWYSQRVLPGGGLSIPGRHVDDDGYVCDENDYICLASCFLEKGTVIDTPLGKQGCVYDYCATANTIDVYVDW